MLCQCAHYAEKTWKTSQSARPVVNGSALTVESQVKNSAYTCLLYTSPSPRD